MRKIDRPVKHRDADARIAERALPQLAQAQQLGRVGRNGVESGSRQSRRLGRWDVAGRHDYNSYVVSGAYCQQQVSSCQFFALPIVHQETMSHYNCRPARFLFLSCEKSSPRIPAGGGARRFQASPGFPASPASPLAGGSSAASASARSRTSSARAGASKSIRSTAACR